VDTHINLYRKMYQIRAAEEAIVEFYPQDEMKTPMHMSMGEEAIVAGVCHALRDQDYVFGTYRSHALYIAKTGETDRFFCELYGKETGGGKGRAGSMHLTMPSKGLLMCSGIVGGTISVATGAALATKIKGDDRISAVFFGDGATDTGTFWESVNYACLEKLPILFVHEDNNFAVHTSKPRRHGHRGVEKVLKNFDIDVIQMRETDAYSVFRETLKAISTIKENKGPVFLSGRYTRILQHIGIIADDRNEGYRFPEDVSSNKRSDPVLDFRNSVIQSGKASEEDVSALELEVEEKVANSIEIAKKTPFAKSTELLTDILL
jgi:acetoin:2,6-dichlorophenolindophenol oxidoreductase subunit alpha